jgi:signal transduction histidine kinase
MMNFSVDHIDQSILTDRISASLRWLVLLGLSIALGTQQTISIPVLVVLFIATVWNSILTVFASLNRRFEVHNSLIVGIDLLIASSLFILSGTFNGPIGWVGIMPIFTASIYFGMSGVISLTAINIFIQSFPVILLGDPSVLLISLAVVAILYLGVGWTFTYIVSQFLGVLNRLQSIKTLERQQAERADNERRQVLYNLISTLSATLNYQNVLETALDMIGTAFNRVEDQPEKLVGAVMLYSPTGNNGTALKIATARRFPQIDLRLEIPGKEGLIGRCINEGKPLLSQNIYSDSELANLVGLQGCKAVYCFPLRSGLDAYGVMLFAHAGDDDFFTEQRREILDIIGKQATIAFQNARLYEDLKVEKERIMEIQEDARRKLARDLHDGPTQSVAALAMRVNYARRLMERDLKGTAEELYKVEDLARQAAKEIRHMLFTLRPLVLESDGLAVALNLMADKMRETFNQNVLVSVDDRIIQNLELSKQTVIFSIAEEAVNNARKHAQAEHIYVRVKSMENDLVVLEVEDDGIGFDMQSIDEDYEIHDSLGLINMRERAELVNGIMNIMSVPGKGTHIKAIIPLTGQAEDRLRREL